MTTIDLLWMLTKIPFLWTSMLEMLYYDLLLKPLLRDLLQTALTPLLALNDE